jgi:hypothetical protein
MPAATAEAENRFVVDLPEDAAAIRARPFRWDTEMSGLKGTLIALLHVHLRP